MIRYAVGVVALTLVYALALASFEPWDLAFGALLSAVLIFLSRRFGRGLAPDLHEESPSRRVPNLPRRFVAFFPFALAVFRDVLVGSWRVVLVVLGFREPPCPRMVVIPLEDRTPTGVAVSAFLAAFSPGTLLVGVDEEERVMLIHALDCEEPDAVREEQRRFYERYQRKVFP